MQSKKRKNNSGILITRTRYSKEVYKNEQKKKRKVTNRIIKQEGKNYFRDLPNSKDEREKEEKRQRYRKR